MRIKHFLLGALLCSASVSAQDIITKSDGSTIQAKVEEITDTNVRYHRFDNLSGPIYSIPLTSISKIVYENGATDTFSAQPTQSAAPQQPAAAPVAEPAAATPKTDLNEAALLRLAMADQLSNTDLYTQKAKKYRKIAWIGGGVFVVGGIISVIWACDCCGWEDADFFTTLIGIPALVGGAAWCTAWNIAANNQKKKAQQAALYSAAIFEEEVLKLGNANLNVSMNAMHLPATRTQGLGLGLTLNF